MLRSNKFHTLRYGLVSGKSARTMIRSRAGNQGLELAWSVFSVRTKWYVKILCFFDYIHPDHRYRAKLRRITGELARVIFHKRESRRELNGRCIVCHSRNLSRGTPFLRTFRFKGTRSAQVISGLSEFSCIQHSLFTSVSWRIRCHGQSPRSVYTG